MKEEIIKTMALSLPLNGPNFMNQLFILPYAIA